MPDSVLDRPYFRDEAAAYTKLESIVWPNGPACLHCGCVHRIGKLKGKATRPGLYKCYNCRKQFRVTMDTVFESSHIPVHTWLQAVFLVVSSKKGVSSNQVHRTMGVTLKTAWFMTMRIREALKPTDTDVLGGGGPLSKATRPTSGAEQGGTTSALPDTTNEELLQNFLTLDGETGLLKLLKGLNAANAEVSSKRNVILMFTENDKLEVRSWREATEALRALFELEKGNPGRDVVLVRAGTTEEVRIAFRNYFSDAREFIRMIDEGCSKLSGHEVPPPMGFVAG